MTVFARSLSPDSESSQTQHSYFIAAVTIVFAVVAFRLFVLRRRNQALSEFFRSRPGAQLRPENGAGYSSYQGVRLAPLPAVYRPDRRVFAADTDAHGRRFGPGEGWDGKDALPAYDGLDRPPKYVEAGRSHGQPTEHEGEQSGTWHPTQPVGGTSYGPRE